MRIRNFIVADAVSQGPQGKFYVHGGGVTSIGALAFPYVHPTLGLLATIVYDSPEDDIEHHLEVLVQMDGSDRPESTIVDLHTDKPPDAFEMRRSWHLLHLIGDVNGLQFKEPGRYWVVLKIDASERDRLMIDVGLTG